MVLSTFPLKNGFCDFPDYEAPDTHCIDGRQYYYDSITTSYRPKNPEETVRQMMIRFLHEALQIPFSAIRVEDPLSHYIPNASKRMDICILAKSEDNCLSPVMIVECKSRNTPITEEVYDQVDFYASELNVFVICVTNGNTIRFLVWDQESNEYRVPVALPNYLDLCSTAKLTTIDQDDDTYIRPEFSSIYTKKRYLEALEEGTIGEDTPEGYAPFILNLFDSFLDNSLELDTLDVRPYTFGFDGGCHYTKFGNAGGGSFDGMYRYLSILDSNNVTHLINFGIFGVAKTVNSTRFGNSRGRTYLIIAIKGLHKAHSALQITLEDHVFLTDKTAYITHNGRMAIGNLGSANCADVINYVLKKDDRFELKNEKLYLGKIDYSKPLTLDQPDMQEFLSNLIRYAFLRDEFRKVVKQQQNRV